MKQRNQYDAIIIGGSYSGLSAGMALGRALRRILIIDSGKPCNIQTPYSHNFITHDGKKPTQIAEEAKVQVMKYNTVEFQEDLVAQAVKTEDGFEITTKTGRNYYTKKIILATGLEDIMPGIRGFKECWGISILHCPYCHGYEVRNLKTGVMAHGEIAFDFVKMISNWTSELLLFTNGKSSLSEEQRKLLSIKNISIIDTEIDSIEHSNGTIEEVILKDGSRHSLKVLYAKIDFQQHSKIAEQLGCEITENGLVRVDMFQKTTIKGVFASGDHSNFPRTLATAVASGTTAGVMLNKELIDEEFIY